MNLYIVFAVVIVALLIYEIWVHKSSFATLTKDTSALHTRLANLEAAIKGDVGKVETALHIGPSPATSSPVSTAAPVNVAPPPPSSASAAAAAQAVNDAVQAAGDQAAAAAAAAIASHAATVVAPAPKPSDVAFWAPYVGDTDRDAFYKVQLQLSRGLSAAEIAAAYAAGVIPETPAAASEPGVVIPPGTLPIHGKQTFQQGVTVYTVPDVVVGAVTVLEVAGNYQAASLELRDPSGATCASASFVSAGRLTAPPAIVAGTYTVMLTAGDGGGNHVIARFS